MPKVRHKPGAMRIDFVITELSPGGAERCCCELAIGLKNRGHNVRVMSLQPLPTGSKRLLVNRLEDNQIQIATADAKRVWHLPNASLHLRRFFREDRPDVVQTMMHHANVLGSVMASRTTDAVLVGGLRVAQRRRVRNHIERWCLHRSAAVVCVSGAVQRFAVSDLAINPSKIRVIANGIDPDRFDGVSPANWTDLGWPDDAVVIVFAGRMHRQKNLDAIFTSAPNWLDRDPRRRLLMIGDGSQASRAETFCETVADDRAKYLSWQPDVACWLKASRVAILPSHYEGMANGALEAMAAGIPIVCSDVEGTDELFPADDKRRRTQVFAAGDSESFDRLVVSFCDNEDLARDIGQRNRRHVQSEHTVPNMIDRYEELYQRLCQPSE